MFEFWYRQRGDLKLFDLGLAKEIPSVGGDVFGCFFFTQLCGTPRYMAPEVAHGLPYREACDVYSFSLLCWQMFALKRPYNKYALKDLHTTVWSSPHKRPTVPNKWSDTIKDIITRGWNFRFRLRPTMKEIEQLLSEEVCAFQKKREAGNNGDDGVGNNPSGEEFNVQSHILRRRSTYVLHKSLVPPAFHNDDNDDGDDEETKSPSSPQPPSESNNKNRYPEKFRDSTSTAATTRTSTQEFLVQNPY